MTRVFTCPDLNQLMNHLEESLAEHEEASLISHLDVCEDCRQTLEGLAAGDWQGKTLPDTFELFVPGPAYGAIAAELAQQGSALPIQASPCADDDPLGGLLEPTDKPGSLGRFGHYEIHEVIGRGGMGIVLRAFDEKLHRVVAIKVMAPHLAANPNSRKRFLREARAAAAVRNEHIVDIHDVDEVKGCPFLVMEHVAGVSLQQRLDMHAPLELREILDIGVQMATGLTAAHAHGLIHRDVKPANVLLQRSPRAVKITDFGLARAANDSTLSRSGVVAGTPQYMSPEQADGKLVDVRADLFSLGTVLYAMSIGRAPFQAETNLAVLKKVCEETPAPIREVNATIPEWFVAIVEKLHAKNPDERFQTASEVAQLLSQHLAHIQQPASLPLNLRKPSARRPSRRRRMVAVAVAAALFMLAIIAAPQFVIRITGKDGKVTEIEVSPGAKVELLKDGKAVASTAGAPNIVNTSVSIRRFEKLTGHVQCVTISPDGKFILVGRRDATMQLLDGTTGKELQDFKGHGDVVCSVAFSADGRQALSSSRDNLVRLWNVATGEEVRRFVGHTGAVNSVAICTDGKRALTGSTDKTLRLWKLETGEELRCFEGHSGGVISLALSADGRRALSGSTDWTMRLWDLEDGRELSCFAGHETWVWSVAFSADGRSALSGSGTHTRDVQGRPFDCLVRLWDVATGKPRRLLAGHAGEITGLAFCSKGQHILSASTDGNVRMWEANTGELVHRFIGHKAPISSLICAADERHFVTGSHDGSVLVWELPPPKK